MCLRDPHFVMEICLVMLLMIKVRRAWAAVNYAIHRYKESNKEHGMLQLGELSLPPMEPILLGE